MKIVTAARSYNRAKMLTLKKKKKQPRKSSSYARLDDIWLDPPRIADTSQTGAELKGNEPLPPSSHRRRRRRRLEHGRELTNRDPKHMAAAKTN